MLTQRLCDTNGSCLRAASSSRPRFRPQPPALLLLYCCLTAALLLLYCCLTAALLLPYWGFTGQHSADTHSAAGGGVHHQLPRRLPQVYLLLRCCCFAAALLLLYCRLTADLLLWITNFPGAYHSGFNNGTHCSRFTSTHVPIHKYKY